MEPALESSLFWSHRNNRKRTRKRGKKNKRRNPNQIQKPKQTQKPLLLTPPNLKRLDCVELVDDTAPKPFFQLASTPKEDCVGNTEHISQFIATPQVESFLEPGLLSKLHSEPGSYPTLSHMDRRPNLSYPKGIPKSFLRAAEFQGRFHSPQPIPPLANVARKPHPYLGQQHSFVPPEAQNVLYSGQQLSYGAQYQHYNRQGPSNDFGTPQMQNTLPVKPVVGVADEREGSSSPTFGEKRLSAFERLGPLTQPKKPKLTINLLFSKEQSVREVIKNEEINNRYIPVQRRKEVLSSTNEVVVKYLSIWPWQSEVTYKKTARPRESKSAMLMEEEQIIEYYEKPTQYIKVMIRECPKHFKKEDALDAILELVRDYTFIPCFIDMADDGICNFLVIKCADAIQYLHKCGLVMQADGRLLNIHVAVPNLRITELNFLPNLVLRKMVQSAFNKYTFSLDLKAFSLEPDISNFIYFPLNRLHNQIELIQLQAVQWSNIVDLNLSHNRLTTLDGFNLGFIAKNLKHLDLSYNLFEKMKALLPFRNLLLRSLKLEGNPLCRDYTDPDHYKRTTTMIFPCLKELDGIKLLKPDEIPDIMQTFCPQEGKELVEKMLQCFYPNLDSRPEERISLETMYDAHAVMTITFRKRLQSSSIYRFCREIFSRARCFEEDNIDSIEGGKAIVKNYCRWPTIKHDPTTFTVDVLLHEETTTIVSVSGMMKASSERLSDDEYLLAFSRTLVLHTKNSLEYKIHNEMLYLEEPTSESIERSFKLTMIQQKRILKIDVNPSKEVKNGLIEILSDLTGLQKHESEKCLSKKDWDLRAAIDYFMSILKLKGSHATQDDA